LGPAQKKRESVLFIGTHSSNLYTAVDTPSLLSRMRDRLMSV
jgi:hypothetical protein